MPVDALIVPVLSGVGGVIVGVGGSLLTAWYRERATDKRRARDEVRDTGTRRQTASATEYKRELGVVHEYLDEFTKKAAEIPVVQDGKVLGQVGSSAKVSLDGALFMRMVGAVEALIHFSAHEGNAKLSGECVKLLVEMLRIATAHREALQALLDEDVQTLERSSEEMRRALGRTRGLLMAITVSVEGR